ncbi:MAG: hypothetical protein IPK67_10320 [Planctomycetes bacterium]|nr:hypothetical protein [Planctomycetota bacterium]
MLELIEPRADEPVAALDLVVEERERQRPVHCLDPQRQTAQLDRERIEIDAVDAALDDVAPQDRLRRGSKLASSGRHGASSSPARPGTTSTAGGASSRRTTPRSPSDVIRP